MKFHQKYQWRASIFPSTVTVDTGLLIPKAAPKIDVSKLLLLGRKLLHLTKSYSA